MRDCEWNNSYAGPEITNPISLRALVAGDTLLYGDILTCGVEPKLQILYVGIKASREKYRGTLFIEQKSTPVLNGSFYIEFSLASNLASVKDRNKEKKFQFLLFALLGFIQMWLRSLK